jgi:hypothetical protein
MFGINGIQIKHHIASTKAIKSWQQKSLEKLVKKFAEKEWNKMKEIRFMFMTTWENSPHEIWVEVEDDATEMEIEEAVQAEILDFIDYWEVEE